MQKVKLTFVIILFFSCTFRQNPIGKENEIIIVSSIEDRPYVEQLMINLFSNIIHTPQPEFEFSLNFKDPWEMESVKTYGNIIIASLDFPEDSTGDYLMSRILNTNKKDEPLFCIDELYIENQVLCGIHSLDAISMENIVNINNEWIINEFRNVIDKRMKTNIFKHGINRNLSKQILQLFGYTIDLQPDYKVIRSDSIRSFIWVGRGLPYRWITIHKSKKNKYNKKDNIWDHLSQEYAEIMPTISISNYFKSYEINKDYNRAKLVMRGVYEHSESETGGPFFVYIFDTNSDNEVILISGFVNQPGNEKILLLKQLEIIVKTFNKGDN